MTKWAEGNRSPVAGDRIEAIKSYAQRLPEGMKSVAGLRGFG